MKRQLSLSSYFFVGSLLFGLFFGAGNLIFPIHMGQEAGNQISVAALGFVLTSTGLPFLGVLAIGKSGGCSLLELSGRVGKTWSYIFTILLYMTIGPLFALPRTGTVSYEIGFSLYMPEQWNQLGLFIFTLCFFGLALFFSLRPGKLLVWVGKILNPLFLLLLGILIIASFIHPMGNVTEALTQEIYTQNAFFKGFTEGYNTMDALASLAFGILVVDALKELGVTDSKDITISTAKAGFVSVLLMVLVYSSLSFMGAMSTGQFPVSANGGIALAQISQYYLGSFGNILLACLVTLACLKTAIGLITACSEAFTTIFPKLLSYRAYVILFTVMACMTANIGLTQIISFSLPILMFLYPLVIVLIILTLLPETISNCRLVYISTTFAAAIFSIGDAFATLPDHIRNLAPIHILLDIYGKTPFFNIGMAWVLPAIIGFILGICLDRITTSN